MKCHNVNCKAFSREHKHRNNNCSLYSAHELRGICRYGYPYGHEQDMRPNQIQWNEDGTGKWVIMPYVKPSVEETRRY